MASQRTETFTQTLQDMEQSGDTSKMAALFSDSAELRNLTHQEPEQGQAGARRFWDRYLSVFDQIRSTFTHTIEGDSSSVLEWSSTGSLAEGSPIEYRGVSVLEWEGEQIRAFRTYYDSAAFVKQEAG